MEVSPPSTRRVIRFDAFDVDLRAGELRKHGRKIKLQQQPFRVLVLLLEHAGEVVTREDLRQAIWPAGTFAEFDEGLDAAIYKVRSALGDSAVTPRFVETLPRRGYRFIAAVEGVVSTKTGAGLRPLEQDAAGVTSRPESPKGAQPAVPVSKRGLLLSAGGLAVLVAVLFASNAGGLRDWLRGRAASSRIRSIAVLPLENLSGDPAQEYFADGMTEALITNLGKIAGLHVISRTSAMHYKRTHETLPEIARHLHVDAVVEGAVLRAGNRVRITVQLVEGSTDRHLWAETYQRELQDVLALQGEVARAITNEVQITLSPQEQTRLAGGRPVNPEAYNAYLKGRYEWNKWTEQGLKQSLAYFEEALQRNPDYAAAWAGVADAYTLMRLWGFSPPEVALPRAKAAALRAIQLDERLSEAHVSLSDVTLHLEWSWAANERELRRAIALNPNNATAHQWYGYHLSATGHSDAAIAEMKRALELDPLSPNKENSLAATFYRAGRYDEALQHFRAVPDPDPNSERRHRFMAAIYERRGMQREAIAELLTALRLAGKEEVAVSVEKRYLASGYAEAKKAFLWGNLRERQRRAKNAYPRPNPVDIAADHALVGERDNAFEWLERAFRDHEDQLMWLKVDERFDALRSDPRFRDLLRRTGLLVDAGVRDSVF